MKNILKQSEHHNVLHCDVDFLSLYCHSLRGARVVYGSWATAIQPTSGARKFSTNFLDVSANSLVLKNFLEHQGIRLCADGPYLYMAFRLCALCDEHCIPQCFSQREKILKINKNNYKQEPIFCNSMHDINLFIRSVKEYHKYIWCYMNTLKYRNRNNDCRTITHKCIHYNDKHKFYLLIHLHITCIYTTIYMIMSFHCKTLLKEDLMGGKRRSQREKVPKDSSKMSDDTIENSPSPLHSTAHDLAQGLDGAGKTIKYEKSDLYRNRTRVIFITLDNEASSIVMEVEDDKLNMFLYHPEHPNSLLSNENIHALKIYLQMCNKVAIMDENSEFVPLMTLHVFDDFLKIVCDNSDTKFWLIQHCFTSFPDFKFQVLYEKWYAGLQKKLNKCSIKIKKREDMLNFKEFIMFLNKQNKGLNILEAEYYGKSDLKDNKNVLIFFGVTDTELIRIKERKGVVFFDVEKTTIQWPNYQEEQREAKKRKLEFIG